MNDSRRSGGVAGLVTEHLAAIVADWQELCRWDPMLPPDSRPAIAPVLVSALASALDRPQPLGWGPDPEMEPVAEAFALAVGTVDEAIGQLVCLREVMVRRLTPIVPDGQRDEVLHRLHMLLDRAIGVAAQRTTSRLREEALTDPLTLLPNRRALERDLRRELARANRHERPLTLVVLDIDDLRETNDRHGHGVGDRHLRTFSTTLGASLRAGDRAYRIGGDEFVVMLPETEPDAVPSLMRRITDEGAPPFSWGAAAYPADGDSEQTLLETADRRLTDARRRRGTAPARG